MMQSKDDEILQKRCFSCRQYLQCPVSGEHLDECLSNIPLQKMIECKGCYCLIEVGKLHKHLNHKTVKCKASFTRSEVERIEKFCNVATKNKQQHSSTENQEPSKKSTTQNNKTKKCKVCHGDFERLIAHVKSNEKCEAGYGKSGLEKLHEEAELERRNYKTMWRQKKSSVKFQEAEERQCKNCNCKFKNLKQHLRQNQVCRTSYSEEQLKELEDIGKAQSIEKKKVYNAKYRESHPPQDMKRMKKEKSFENKFHYELYERKCHGVDVTQLKSVFYSQLKWKISEFQKLKETTLLKLNEFAGKNHQENHQEFESGTAMVDKIEQTLKNLKDEMGDAISFLQKAPNGIYHGSSNVGACKDIVKYFNEYLGDTYKLCERVLGEFLENLKWSSNSIPFIAQFSEWFQSSAKEISDKYSTNFEKAKDDQKERLARYKLEERRADAFSVHIKLRRIWLPQVKSNLETYSTWIPKYKAKIEEYRKQCLTKEDRISLSDLEKSIDETFKKYCQEEVEELLSKYSLSQVMTINNGNIEFELFYLLFECKLTMEKCEVMLRHELCHANEVLQNFGSIPSLSEDEIKLKFGSNPDYDFVCEGEGKILRLDETKEMLHNRMKKDTDTYLQNWLNSEYDMIDGRIYEKPKSVDKQN